jgi:nitrogen-specific signal transduction histidine kinase
MNPVSMTLLATASEPSELEARTHAIKNCVCVILGLASTLERHVDPVARPRVTHLVDASRRLTTLLTGQGQTRPCDRARKDVRTSDVLGLVVHRLGPQAETCGVEVAIERADGGRHPDLAELAEARKTISRHAGVMHVESVEGHGTTVIIWLPATLAKRT